MTRGQILGEVARHVRNGEEQGGSPLGRCVGEGHVEAVDHVVAQFVTGVKLHAGISVASDEYAVVFDAEFLSGLIQTEVNGHESHTELSCVCHLFETGGEVFGVGAIDDVVGHDVGNDLFGVIGLAVCDYAARFAFFVKEEAGDFAVVTDFAAEAFKGFYQTEGKLVRTVVRHRRFDFHISVQQADEVQGGEVVRRDAQVAPIGV